jgi:methylenetetrahydrofolate reductase (NADPH)
MGRYALSGGTTMANSSPPSGAAGHGARDRVRDPVACIAQRFSIETTPRAASKIADFREHVPAGTSVYVTSLPGSRFEDTLQTCTRLRSEGMEPVPHITARSIPDAKTLDAMLESLHAQAGVKAVLALGGADREPAGEFEDSASMLETGLFARHGIQSIGIAGHPEGSPDIERLMLRDYGFRKMRYAQSAAIRMHLVTQFVFEVKPLVTWLERIRGDGNPLPVVIGLPGPASLKALIGHASNCGIGPSMRFLTRQARSVQRLLTQQAPDALLQDVAELADRQPGLGIAGIHLFTLGNFADTAAWARSKVAHGACA